MTLRAVPAFVRSISQVQKRILEKDSSPPIPAPFLEQLNFDQPIPTWVGLDKRNLGVGGSRKRDPVA